MHGSNLRRARRQRAQQGGLKDFLLPFLILICFGLIVVLGVGLWRSFFSVDRDAAAYMHLSEGSVGLKVWGTENYFDLDSDTLVMQGDAIKTDNGSRVILEFFDGTIMRVDGNSEVVFDSIDEEDGSQAIELTLNSGALWFNKVYKDTEATDIRVKLDHVVVNSDMASIFMVDKSGDQGVVRVKNVFEDNGGVLVEVMPEGAKEGDKAIETEKIGVAQQITFSPKVIQRYWDFKSPTVLTGMSDNFKDSAWYKWNIKEDKSPVQFEKTSGDLENVGLVKVEEEKIGDEEESLVPDEDNESEDTSEVTDDEEKTDTEEDKPEASGTLAKPTITSVSGATQTDANGYYVVTANPATLVGSVSGAQTVVVNGYTLQKYQAGSGSWTYYANSDFGLMKQGENTFEIYALDAEGNKSEPLIIKVIFAPPAPAPVAEEPAPESVPAEGEEAKPEEGSTEIPQ